MAVSNPTFSLISHSRPGYSGSRRRLTLMLIAWSATGLTLCLSGISLRQTERYLGSAWLWAVAIPAALLLILHPRRSVQLALAVLRLMAAACGHTLKTVVTVHKPRAQAGREIGQRDATNRGEALSAGRFLTGW